MHRIGVDVGGTNTDAVLMRGREVIAAHKSPTTADVASGVQAALIALLMQSGLEGGQIDLVVIGTTRFTNAVVERRGLSPTAAIRLCGPATRSLPPMVDWPNDLRAAVGAEVYFAAGGLDYDGRAITPLDEAEIRRIGMDVRRSGVTAIAICGVFSSVSDAMEQRAAALLSDVCPGVDISYSAGIGRIGLLERESATILNSALLALARQTVSAMKAAVAACGLRCPFFISQNDGTLMNADQVQRFPILTIASGPTNSMRGAAFLSEEKDALVVDVGGTTTDVGLLQNGFPRQSAQVVSIGGVRTNFRMPDLLSVGLGGGSVVAVDALTCRIGPMSVGYELTTKARLFGGDVLTATDVAVAAGRADLGAGRMSLGLEPELVTAALGEIDRILGDAVDRCRVSSTALPVVVVGGGSILAPARLAGLSVIRPKHFEVANAIGAAIAQTSGEVDRVVSLGSDSREAALLAAETDARRLAVQAGAVEDTIIVTEREDVPLAYLPGNATRIHVRVVGDLGDIRRA